MMNFLTTEFSPAKRVDVGVLGLPDTTLPPTGFYPNSFLDATGNKTYSAGNSARQVPHETADLRLLQQMLPLQQPQLWLLQEPEPAGHQIGVMVQ
jgi:hypothetical protein